MNIHQTLLQMKDWIKIYYVGSAHFYLALAAYAFLFFTSKDVRKKLFWPMVLMGALLLNPILYQKFFDRTRYWRWFWMIINAPAIAAAVVRLNKMIPQKNEKLIVYFSLLFYLVVSGRFAYNSSLFFETRNVYKLEPETVRVGEIILSAEPSPCCICPAPLHNRIRQYSGEITQLYGRDAEGFITSGQYTEQQIIIYFHMQSGHPDYQYVLSVAEQAGCNVLVTRKEEAVSEDVLNLYNYEMIGESQLYCVYHRIGG